MKKVFKFAAFLSIAPGRRLRITIEKRELPNRITRAPDPLIRRLPIASRRPSMLPQPAIIIVRVIPRFAPNTHGTMVVPGSSPDWARPIPSPMEAVEL